MVSLLRDISYGNIWDESNPLATSANYAACLGKLWDAIHNQQTFLDKQATYDSAFANLKRFEDNPAKLERLRASQHTWRGFIVKWLDQRNGTINTIVKLILKQIPSLSAEFNKQATLKAQIKEVLRLFIPTDPQKFYQNYQQFQAEKEEKSKELKLRLSEVNDELILLTKNAKYDNQEEQTALILSIFKCAMESYGSPPAFFRDHKHNVTSLLEFDFSLKNAQSGTEQNLKMFLQNCFFYSEAFPKDWRADFEKIELV